MRAVRVNVSLSSSVVEKTFNLEWCSDQRMWKAPVLLSSKSFWLCLVIGCGLFVTYKVAINNPHIKAQLDQYDIVKSYKSGPISPRNKTILLWTSFFNNKNWYLPGDLLNSSFFESLHCPVTNCIVTNDRDFLPPTDAFDAVLFHTAEPFSILSAVPPTRHPTELYVFSTMESPPHTKHDLSDEGNFYNLTMTYRLDSDILWNYGSIVDIETQTFVAPALSPPWKKPPAELDDEHLLNITKGKTKLAAWFVSHCHTYSTREELVKSLQNYIQVDVYGTCGPLKCPYKSHECDDSLDRDYMFYLSFENSICTDYITEKFYNALQRQVIPVVFGGADYNRFAPPHSYINAESFATTKDLADHLTYLSKNPKEYAKYFWWKKYYKVGGLPFPGITSPYCQLCMILNSPARMNKIQTYTNIESWWLDHSCRTKYKIQF